MATLSAASEPLGGASASRPLPARPRRGAGGPSPAARSHQGARARCRRKDVACVAAAAPPERIAALTGPQVCRRWRAAEPTTPMGAAARCAPRAAQTGASSESALLRRPTPPALCCRSPWGLRRRPAPARRHVRAGPSTGAAQQPSRQRPRAARPPSRCMRCRGTPRCRASRHTSWPWWSSCRRCWKSATRRCARALPFTLPAAMTPCFSPLGRIPPPEALTGIRRLWSRRAAPHLDPGVQTAAWRCTAGAPGVAHSPDGRAAHHHVGRRHPTRLGARAVGPHRHAG